MSNDVQIIEQKSDITPVDEAQNVAEAIAAPFIEAAEARETEEKGLKELQDAAFEAEKTIAAYRAARLAFVRKHTECPKTELLDKQPSELHESLAMYIAEKTGCHLDGQVIKVVQLTLALHGEHQKSPEWKARRAQMAADAEARLAKLAAAKASKSAVTTTKKVDKISAAIQVGIEMMKSGVKLPDDVMANLKTAAELAGIELPVQEPETPEAKVEEPVKPAKPQRISRAAKAAVGRAISAEQAKVDA